MNNENIAKNIKAKLKQRRKIRIILILLFTILVAIFVGSIVYGLRSTINFFRTPSQITDNDLVNQHYLRLGGYVVKGSIVKNTQNIFFTVTDGTAEIRVSYAGVIPNLFAEGEEILAEGRLVAIDLFIADRILAKHDEKYKSSIIPPKLTPDKVKKDDH
ncbi:cytochrome c maturation protein CcmE [Bartonella sp. DGB1]|uniref:cytochrome c maturation protein CcmE n=1 Tax=Bartonella sp. DGB1 TaxID=3239807 RepID=UPI003523FE5D